jgi:hypothetical protein
MSDFSQIKITNKTRNLIIKASNFNVKKDIVSVIKNSEVETTVKILNPEQMEDNQDKAEKMVLELFYPETKDWDNLDFQEYDKYKKDLMEFLTENQETYSWIIDLKLCDDHKKISEDRQKKVLKGE